MFKNEFYGDSNKNVVTLKDGSKLRICCACPETKKLRDLCILESESEDNCKTEMENHKKCLKALGFKV